MEKPSEQKILEECDYLAFLIRRQLNSLNRFIESCDVRLIDKTMDLLINNHKELGELISKLNNLKKE